MSTDPLSEITNSYNKSRTARSSRLSPDEISDTLRQAGWDEQHVPTMTAIAQAESSGNPLAHNTKYPDDSYGLLQVNRLAHPQYSPESLRDPVGNAKAGLDVFRKQGFGAWSVYKSGEYKKYLQHASQSPSPARGPLAEQTQQSSDPLTELSKQYAAPPPTASPVPEPQDATAALARLGNQTTRATRRLMKRAPQPQGGIEQALANIANSANQTTRTVQQLHPLTSLGEMQRGAPTMSSVLQDAEVQSQLPANRLRAQIRKQVQSERATTRAIGIPDFYTKNPLNAVAETLLGTSSVTEFGGRLLNDLPGTISRMGPLPEDVSVANETERRAKQVESDAADAKRLLLDDSGKYRQDVLDEYQKLTEHIQQDPQWWWRSVDVAQAESGARVFRTVAGLARVFFAGGPNAHLADDLERKALVAERAMQDIRDGALPTEEQQQRRVELQTRTGIANDVLARGQPFTTKEEAAAFVVNTIADLAQLELFTTAGGPVAGFAAHSGAQALGRNEPLKSVLGETAKGAALGETFAVAPAFRSATAGPLGNFARESAAIGAGTVGVEELSGADPLTAATSALTNVAFHGIGQAAKIPGALKDRFGEKPSAPEPTVPPELQNRLTARDLTAQGYEVTSAPGEKPRIRLHASESVPKAKDGYVRFYRADRVDAQGPLGQNWVTDPEYASQKHGAGQMQGSETIWYIDVPKHALDEGYGDWRAVSGTTTDVLAANGIRIEPKLYRRVAAVPSVTEPVTKAEEAVPSDPLAEVLSDVQRRAAHYSNRQPRRARNVKTGKKGQFKAGKPAPAEESAVNVLTGRPVATKKLKDSGFINVTEIQDAIDSLRQRYPEMEESEARDILEAQRPYLFQPGVSRADELRMEHADRTELARNKPHPELQRKLSGDAGVQSIEQLRSRRPPSTVEPARQFAKRKLADTFGEEEASLARAGENAAFEARQTNADMQGRREIARNFSDVPSPRTARPEIDLTTQDIDAGPRGKKTGEEGYVNVSEIAKAIRQVKDEVLGKDRGLRYILTLPTGRELAIDLIIDRKGVAHPMLGPVTKLMDTDVTGVEQVSLGTDTLLALRRFLLQTHPEIKRVDYSRAGSTGGVVGRKVNLPVKPRTTPELPPAAATPRSVDLDAVKRSLAARGLEVQELAGDLPTFSVRKSGREVAKFASGTRERALASLADYADRSGEHGYVNLSEIHAAIKKVSERVYDDGERTVVYHLKRKGSTLGVRLNILPNGHAEPIIGPLTTYGHIDVNKSAPKLDLGVDTIFALRRYIKEQHPEIKYIDFTRQGSTGGAYGRVGQFKIGQEGYLNVGDVADVVRKLRSQFPDKSDEELRALAVQQREKLQPSELEAKRTGARVLSAMNRYANLKSVEDVAGLPDTVQSAKPEIRDVAQRLKTAYKALETHQARKQGLGEVTDTSAKGYLKSLRDFVRVHEPEKLALVERAESEYAKGNYAEATRLSEAALTGTHEFVSQLGGALMSRTETAAWHNVLTEVRRRAKEMGLENPIERFLKSEEGTARVPGRRRKAYDVTKSPKGSIPDTDAISEIIDPAVEKLWIHANQLAQQGKLKGKTPVQATRDLLTKMIEEGLSDWHIVNRNAAKAVAARRLSEISRTPEGKVRMKPEKVTEETPVEQAQRLGGRVRKVSKAREEEWRANKLWKTLIVSGRLAGNKTEHPVEEMAKWTEQAEKLLHDLGPEATERFYETAKPSGVRTEVGRVLGDYYQVEAARTNDKDLLARSIELANERVTEATELGRAVKAFDANNKFTLSGSLDEATRLYRQGTKDPKATLPADLAQRVNELAVKRAEAKKKVDELSAKVESEPERPVKRIPRAEDPGQRGAVSPFANTPEVVAARQRKQQASKTLKLMEKKVGKYWTKQSQPALEAARIELRDATHDLSMLYRALQQRGGNSPTAYTQRIMNLQRSLMVSAFSTAIRNTQTQIERSIVERITDAVEHSMRRGVGLNTEFTYADIARNTLRLKDTSSWDFAEQILKEHPDEFFRMFSTYAGGVDIPFPNPVARGMDKVFGTAEKAAYYANTFNRIQEFHIRSAEFLAELELHTKKQTGISLEQFIAQRGAEKLPPKLISAAIDKALEVTFAANPDANTDFGRMLTQLIKFGNMLPPTASPAAFPRFMFNNLKFLYQYSPLGALDIPRVAYRGGNIPRAVARTLIGTSMFLLAYQVRKDERLAGGKWYELKTPAGTFDMRPFGPFSTYLFFGEAVRRYMRGERPMQFKEWAEALGASTAPGGLAISTVERMYDYYEKGDWDKLSLMLKSELGDVGRALFTPVRQIKDTIAQFDAQERITRDTKDQPLLGPIRESIPYASRSLPPAYRPTSGRPIQQEAPLLKVATGFRKISPKSYIEEELDRLHFRSNEIFTYTGNSKLDNYLKQRTGEYLDQQADALQSDVRYQRSSEAMKFFLMKAKLKEARAVAMGDAAQSMPDEYLKYRLRHIPAARRAVLEEQGALPQP